MNRLLLLLFRMLPWLALPYIAVHLWSKARRQKAYGEHLGERFGFYTQSAAPGAIWVHAVSLGEVRAAHLLATQLLEQHADRTLLITHMTPAGRSACADLQGPRIQRVYLPYDFHGAVRRFIHHYRPAIGLLVETELWPNLITLCRTEGVPLVLVNGRLSDAAYRAYRRIAPVTTLLLKNLSGVSALSEEDAQRFRALGAQQVRTLGNMKFDTSPNRNFALDEPLSRLLARRQVIFLASSHHDEEEAVMSAFLATGADETLLIIAPRHPQRFEEVCNLMIAKGLAPYRRSQLISPSLAVTPIPAEARVVLMDSMGEMAAFYRASQVAIMGGTLVPRGGQNFIEACQEEVAVILGPSVFNFSDAPRAIAQGAVVQVADATAAIAFARSLLADEEARQSLASKGATFAREHVGASQRTAQWVGQLLGTLQKSKGKE